MGAATAVEKKAFVLFALFSALRERRCTPREVSIVDDVDDEVEVSGGECQQPTRRGIKFAVQTPTPRCRPAPTSDSPAPALRRALVAPSRTAHAPQHTLSRRCVPIPHTRPCRTHTPRRVTVSTRRPIAAQEPWHRGPRAPTRPDSAWGGPESQKFWRRAEVYRGRRWTESWKDVVHHRSARPPSSGLCTPHRPLPRPLQPVSVAFPVLSARV